MTAISWTITDVNPGEIMLVNGLVNRQIKLAQQGIELTVGFTATGSDVGSLAFHVLTCLDASHRHIQSRASITAVDMNGLSPSFPQRVENIVDQCCEIVDYLLRWSVVNTSQLCCC